MKKWITGLLLLAFVLTACTARPDPGMECIYMKCQNGPMVYIPNEGPCYLESLTEKQLKILEPLKTGDVIEIRTQVILESYPAKTSPSALRFLREGDETALPADMVRQLREMGHLIVTGDTPDFVPDFEIVLTWNAYGISHYDSKSGELIKTTDASRPEDYKTVHLLTDAERCAVWNLLTEMNFPKVPSNYLPNPEIQSEPDTKIELTVNVGDQSSHIVSRGSAFSMIDDSEKGAEARRFINAFNGLTELLENCDEWKALPDYEHYYE